MRLTSRDHGSDHPRDADWRIPIPKKALTAGSLVVFALACGWGYVQFRWVEADRHYNGLRAHLEGKNWKEAAVAGERSLKFNPYRLDTRHYLGQIYLELGETEKARTLLERVDRSSPHYPQNLYYLAEANLQLKALEEAESKARHANLILPEDATLHNLLGRIYGTKGDAERALEHFREAVRLKPHNRLYQFNLGVEAVKSDRYLEAVEAFRAILAKNARKPVARKNLGLILFYKLDRQEDGVMHLKEYLRYHPKTADSDGIRHLIGAYEQSVNRSR